jgi:transcriptional regulator with XRE-family HTH domain
MQEQFDKENKISFEDNVTVRLSTYLKAKEITQSEFASWLDVTRQNIGNMLHGRSKLQINHLAVIRQKCPDLDILWLLFGEGSMYRTNHERKAEELDTKIKELMGQVKDLQDDKKQLRDGNEQLLYMLKIYKK